jgi:hypothetical protein
LATIVQLVCAAILVGAWVWGRAFWRWRYRSSPAAPERHLTAVPTPAEDTRSPDLSGRGSLLERLAAAEGATVYNSQGKQLGQFSEVVASGGEAAIRQQRVLPVATVEAVLPEHGPRGAVVLNIADKTDARETDDESVEHYLLFVPTPEGYQLLEREGGMPAILDEVSMPGEENVFCVIKVSRSPLPGDERPCAYLERR